MVTAELYLVARPRAITVICLAKLELTNTHKMERGFTYEKHTACASTVGQESDERNRYIWVPLTVRVNGK